MKNFWVLTILFSFLTPAYADSYSGAELKRFADAGAAIKEGQAGVDQVGAGVYVGYLAGVAGSFLGVYYCPPVGVTLLDEAVVVARYLNENPDKLAQPAQMLVVKALGIAYPCAMPADTSRHP